MKFSFPNTIGWVAVTASALLTGFWAFWGIIENFHEGWYHKLLVANLAMMFSQYLSPMFGFMAVGLLSVRWPRVGGSLHVVVAIFAAWFFSGASRPVLLLFICGPLVLLGVAYFTCPLKQRAVAAGIIIGIPLVVLVACGIEPAIRGSQRYDDGDRGARHLKGNGVDLIWAPQGPGWPLNGVNWHEAVRRCRHLTEDGESLADTPQDIWRLPTADEAVRSQHRQQHNSAGQWNSSTGLASYDKRPDKESPLWDTHSQVIYWWTGTEIDEGRAYIIVYDGKTWSRSKDAQWGYLGFRAVKEPENGLTNR